jgi:hypothetical protein
MKLYQLFILSTAFFHIFLCLGMNLDSITAYHFNVARIPFPERERQILINFCNTRLYRKHVAKFNSESSQLLQQIEERQKTNVALKTHQVELLEEITTLEKQVQTLEKKLILVEEKKSVTKPKNCSIKKQPLPDKKTINSPVQTIGKNLTSQEKLNGLKLLMNQYSVREKSILLEKLREDADRNQNSPYFDKESHFFCREINTRYRYIFCPCTNQLAIVGNNPTVPLPNDFACSDNCQFYRDKNVSSSDSSDIDTSTETEPESDTEEETLQPVLLDKEAIEKIAD